MSSFNNFNGTTLPSGGPAFHTHPGIANPTASNNIDGFSRVNPNFEDSPNTKRFGAGSGPEFVGQKIQTERPGLNEYNSGMIESTNIDPLNESSNKDDGWANAPNTRTTTGPSGPTTSGTNSGRTATGFVAGVAKLAYGKVAGDEGLKQQGREGVHGTK